MLLDIKPIKTNKDLEAALLRIDTIIDAVEGSREKEELEIISILVRDYEEKHYPISLPDPIESIKIRMEDLELQPKDLEEIIGGKAAVSFILNRQRALSKSMIRGLHEKLHIPYEILFQDYTISNPDRKLSRKKKPKKYSIEKLEAGRVSSFVKETKITKSKKIKKVKSKKVSNNSLNKKTSK